MSLRPSLKRPEQQSKLNNICCREEEGLSFSSDGRLLNNEVMFVRRYDKGSFSPSIILTNIFLYANIKICHLKRCGAVPSKGVFMLFFIILERWEWSA